MSVFHLGFALMFLIHLNYFGLIVAYGYFVLPTNVEKLMSVYRLPKFPSHITLLI
jgi:hypothetical protein